MKDERISLVVKSIIWGLVWLVLALLIGFLITKTTNYKNFENVLFIEGLILIFIGIFSSISGDPMGVSMHYIEVRNKKQKPNVKTDIAFALSTFSLLIGGALSVIITFIM